MAVVEAIATTYLEADATSVTFSSIPSTYQHLQLRCSLKSSRAGSEVDGFRLTFNSDTANNYAYHWMRGWNATAGVGGSASNRLQFQNMVATKTTTPAALFSTYLVDIFDYAHANKNATVGALGAANETNWTVASMESGMWDNPATKPHSGITSIQLDQVNGPYFMRGSEFTLYGWKNA